MDRITTQLLADFASEQGLESELQSKQFEHFSAYLMTLNHFTDSFSTEDIVSGSGNDTGIDAISIIANGCLISEPEEIEELVDTNGYLEVTFVFVQAETLSSFDSAKIGQFAFGVQDFISEEPKLPRNDEIRKKAAIFSRIYNKSSKFSRGNPGCYLYYVTTGVWVKDAHLEARRQSAESDILSKSIFSKVSFRCQGASEIHVAYRNSKNAITCEIAFPEKVALPELKGIQQAYIGVLPIGEYAKLIHNVDEEIIHSFFYDNVRHWQEWNAVNKEIAETLKDRDKQQFLPIFNNGVTIVARNIRPTGNKLILEDYQIVNGCQTSCVIHEHFSEIDPNVRVPVRLIATSDQEIKNSIIKATNRQTTVGDDQLIALTDFPKKLEEFFPTYDGHKRLFYERRSRQFGGQDSVEKVRVVNMTSLVRAFASIFLDLPHRTTRNYKSLLKVIGKDIFKADDRLEMYYVAGFCHYRLEKLFRTRRIDPSLKVARYHLLMVFRHLSVGEPLPRARNSADMRKFCEALLEVAWDDVKSTEIFEKAVALVKAAANGNFHRDNIRTELFTKLVVEEVGLRHGGAGSTALRRARP